MSMFCFSPKKQKISRAEKIIFFFFSETNLLQGKIKIKTIKKKYIQSSVFCYVFYFFFFFCMSILSRNTNSKIKIKKLKKKCSIEIPSLSFPLLPIELFFLPTRPKPPTSYSQPPPSPLLLSSLPLALLPLPQQHLPSNLSATPPPSPPTSRPDS